MGVCVREIYNIFEAINMGIYINNTSSTQHFYMRNLSMYAIPLQLMYTLQGG